MKLDRSSFKNQEKKLKKHHQELNRLDKVIRIIKRSYSFQELRDNELSKLYRFKKLKEDLKDYYSFNLCGHGGKIRLIFTIDEESNIVKLIFISMNHYDDFKKYLKR